MSVKPPHGIYFNRGYRPLPYRKSLSTPGIFTFLTLRSAGPALVSPPAPVISNTVFLPTWNYFGCKNKTFTAQIFSFY